MRRALTFIMIILTMILFMGCGGNKEAKDNKSGNTATQQSKSANTVEAALAKFDIKGKVISSTFGNNPGGFMANVDNRIYLVDLLNNQVASVENFSYVFDNMRKQQASSGDGVIIPQFLIYNDKHDKDDNKGEWRNNHHFIPVYVPIRFDGAGNVRAEGRISTGRGAAPSHFHDYLAEQKNIDLTNLFLKEVVPFTSAIIPASVPAATNQASASVAAKPSETTAGNQTIRIRKVSATSYLRETNQSYPPSNVIDGDIKTCWAEGARGYGIMESVSFDFDNIYTITGFNIWTGYQKSEDLYRKNSRPLAVRVTGGDNYNEFHNLRDSMGMQRILLKRPIKTSHVLITVIEVNDGSPIQDTCISEISFF